MREYFWPHQEYSSTFSGLWGWIWVIRGIGFLGNISLFIFMQTVSPDAKFVLFLTDWGLCFNIAYMGYSFTISLLHSINRHNKCIQNSCVWKTCQFLFLAAIDLESVVTFAYWLSQLFIDTDDPKIKTEIRMQHFLPELFILLDFVLNDMKILFKHFLLLQFVYLPYMILNILYTYISNGSVYPIVEWNNLQSIGAILFIEGLALIFCFIFALFSRLKKSPRTLEKAILKEPEMSLEQMINA